MATAAGAAAGAPAGWAQIAGWYDDLVCGGSGPHELAVAMTMRLAGDVRGARVLDLACGQGVAARALARDGATVTGVDLAPEMIELARRHETSQPLGISYLADDAQHLTSLAGESFDLVNCQLALMDIPDLRATLTAVAGVLRPGGAFVFVIGHPCFLAPEATTERTADGRPARLISHYLTERFWRSANPNGVRRAGNYHRPLSAYLNALTASGLTLEVADESPAAGRLAAEQPVYQSLPIFFGGRAIRS